MKAPATAPHERDISVTIKPSSLARDDERDDDEERAQDAHQASESSLETFGFTWPW